VRKIVLNLKEFSHVDKEEKMPANINDGVESTLNIVWNELKYKADVEREYGDIPEVYCYIQELNQVFMNLLVNAAHAIEGHGTIKVRTYCEESSVCVSIADTGKGMSAEVQKRIFEPFYTTKVVGEGTGLGLSIGYGIVVDKHGGQLLVDSSEGKGTIKIPIGTV
jgi:two-component system, NtrC family, sensor kinase